MADQYRSVMVDGISVPTTDAGARAIEKLQAQNRALQAEVEGGRGVADALNSVLADRGETASDPRAAAKDARKAMIGRLNGGYKTA